jgi:hypothetical protein
MALACTAATCIVVQSAPVTIALFGNCRLLSYRRELQSQLLLLFVVAAEFPETQQVPITTSNNLGMAER